MDDSVRDVYVKAVELLSDGVDISDFVAIAGMLVELVQRRKALKGKGSVKKQVVLEVFKLIVTVSGIMTVDQADLALEFAENTLPFLIDTLKRLGSEIAKYSNGQSCCCW